jgi:predicted enzyme related to lactoylglutathione lyase
MNRVIHFELAADNPERAIAFYGKTFGWKMVKGDGPADYWLIMTGPEEGNPFGLMQADISAGQ